MDPWYHFFFFNWIFLYCSICSHLSPLAESIAMSVLINGLVVCMTFIILPLNGDCPSLTISSIADKAALSMYLLISQLNEWFSKWRMNGDLGQTNLKSKSCIWFWPLKTSRMALCSSQLLWLDCSQVRKKISSVLLKEIIGLGSQSGNFCWSAQRALVVIHPSEPQVSEYSTKNIEHSKRDKSSRLAFALPRISWKPKD